MSFTLDFSTQRLNPVYNEVVYVTSESLADNFNGFESVANIKVNGTSIAIQKIQPNPEGFSIFDIHRILESQLSFDYDPSSSAVFRLAPNSVKRFEIDFIGEGDSINTFNMSGPVLGNVRALTNYEHGLTTGDTVTVTNNIVPSYNGTFTITNVPSSTSMDLDLTFVQTTTTPDSGLMFRGDGDRWVTTGLTTSEAYAFNGVIDWVNFPTFDGTDFIYTGGTGTTKQLLTSIDPTIRYGLDIDSYIYLNAFQDKIGNGAGVDKIEITTNNGTFEISNPFSADTNANLGLQINISPRDLQSLTGVTVVSGSLPIIDSTTTTYSVDVQYFSADSTTYLFEIEDNCSKYDIYNFVFLDKLGSFIPVSFNLVSKINKRINKKSYKANYGSFNSSSSQWGYNTWDRGKTRLNTSVLETVTITSDYITEDAARFVEMMIESPEVYVTDTDGNIQAIDIIDRSYTEKTRINDKLINYEIKFEYSQTNNSQRG